MLTHDYDSNMGKKALFCLTGKILLIYTSSTKYVLNTFDKIPRNPAARARPLSQL